MGLKQIVIFLNHVICLAVKPKNRTEENTDLGTDEDQVNLGFVVGPGPKLHGAVLIVKGEIGDVHGAGGLEDSRRNPGDGTIELEQSLGLVLDQEVPHGTEQTKTSGVTDMGGRWSLQILQYLRSLLHGINKTQ